MEFVFCTNNAHKLLEVSQILNSDYTFLTLSDIAYTAEIPEPYFTLEENSFAKANQVFKEKGRNCFAEDSGLFIESLNGEPGVFSARYAGEDANAEKNIDLVLEKLQQKSNRRAYFKTVITSITAIETKQFVGVCEGSIALQKSGVEGFGYDPIFIPDGSSLCFAEMTAIEKNAISHRRKAFDLFAKYLKSLSTIS